MGKGTRRACSSVSWNRNNHNHVAAGFELLKGDFCVLLWDIHQQREKDKEAAKDRQPLVKLCYEEATSSLCWLPDNPHMLTVGTSMGWVRIFDTRVGDKGSAEASLMAHPAARPRKVKGVMPDPFNSHILATYSDTAGESIKLWDIRKDTSSKSKLTALFTISPGEPEGQQGAQVTVTDFQWSLDRANVCVVATNRHKQILFFNTSKSAADVVTRTPIHTIPINESIKSMSWEVPIGSSRSDSEGSTNRLLVATQSKVVECKITESVPLSFSSKGTTINGAYCVETSLPTMKTKKQFRSIEQIIQYRCSRGYSLDAGKNLQVLSDEYEAQSSDDANKDNVSATDNGDEGNGNDNIEGDNNDTEVVKDEDMGDKGDEDGRADVAGDSSLRHVRDIMTRENSPLSESSSDFTYLKNVLELTRVWSWVDRIESLPNEDLSLWNCGVLAMLQEMSSKDDTSHERHPLFSNIPYYSSTCRDSVRVVCGWTSIYDERLATKSNEDISGLETIVEECEVLDSFERAAALAIWHGDIDLGINVLRRNTSLDQYQEDHSPEVKGVVELGSKQENNALKNKNNNSTATGGRNDYEYQHTISMVSMCFAGFTGNMLRKSTAWANMCQATLVKLESYVHSRPSANYLVAICRFMLHVVSLSGKEGPIESSYDFITSDDKLYLEDRIAFASFYLSLEQNMEWISHIDKFCKETGSVEGLLITGLNQDGTLLLQQYIDRYDDIQTAALLVCRNINDALTDLTENKDGSVAGVENLFIEKSWLLEYRNLLNQWELFIDRATLDVELGKRQRNFQLFNEKRQVSVRNKGESGNDNNNDNSNEGKVSNVSGNAPGSASEEDKNNMTEGSGSGNTSGNADASNASSSSTTMTSGTSGASKYNKTTSSALLMKKGASTATPGDKGRNVKRIMYALPPHNEFPHIFLRCHYCSSSLPVDAMQPSQNTAFLRKQKPVINFCPNCKKPLPRCYVCQLYMGLINPHAEVNRMLSLKRKNNTNALTTKSENTAKDVEHNVLDLGRWLFFCQRCKHGGHAGCIDSWFNRNEDEDIEGDGDSINVKRFQCGVNNCSCNCML